MQKQSDGTLKATGYFSKKLSPTEQRYATIDRETLAIILSCRKFHNFLWGFAFIIHTDHEPLVSFFKQKTKSSRMNRWVVEMQDYKFKIVYHPAKKNQVADQLSHQVCRLYQQHQDLCLTKSEMIEKQYAAPKWNVLTDYSKGGALPCNKNSWILLKNFLVYEGLLCLSSDKMDNSIQLKLVIAQELRKVAL